MNNIIKWIITPKCKDCAYYNAVDCKCKLKFCLYKNKR